MLKGEAKIKKGGQKTWWRNSHYFYFTRHQVSRQEYNKMKINNIKNTETKICKEITFFLSDNRWRVFLINTCLFISLGPLHLQILDMGSSYITRNLGPGNFLSHRTMKTFYCFRSSITTKCKKRVYFLPCLRS